MLTTSATQCVFVSDVNENDLAQIFISADHAKGNYGVCSPGPTTALPARDGTIGRCALSGQGKVPAWGFSTSERSIDYGTDNPGPGEYYA